MRILFLTQYFWPEMGAASNRMSYFAQSFAKKGHAVTVLTMMPNYPEGTIFEGYRGRSVLEEENGGVRIVRVWGYATKTKTFSRRLLSYFSFVLTSLILGTRRVGPQDVVLVESPPLFLGISGFVLKVLKRARLVLNVSDLWPETGIAMGAVKNRWLIRAATALEEFLYRHSDLITGQTRGIVKNIQSRIPEKPIALITNGVDSESLPRRPDDAAEKKATLGWQGKFLVGYTGLHGLAQGLNTVIDAAHILASYPDITFLFFGEGVEKDKVVARARELGLKNVKFYPMQPKRQIQEIISIFDVCVVPLLGLDLFRGALPSKMFEAMGIGVPVVASIVGEARALITEASGGICVAPENPHEMAEAILQLYNDPALRMSMGANAREYVTKYYDSVLIAQRFEQLVSKTAELSGTELRSFVDRHEVRSAAAD